MKPRVFTSVNVTIGAVALTVSAFLLLRQTSAVTRDPVVQKPQPRAEVSILAHRVEPQKVAVVQEEKVPKINPRLRARTRDIVRRSMNVSQFPLAKVKKKAATAPQLKGDQAAPSVDLGAPTSDNL